MKTERTAEEKILLSQELWTGVSSGDLQTVERLIQDGVQEGMGFDLLWQAFSAGHVEIAEFLLKSGRKLGRIPDLPVLLKNPRALESVELALTVCDRYELKHMGAEPFVKTGSIALLSVALNKVPDPRVFFNRQPDHSSSKSPLAFAIEMKGKGQGDTGLIDFMLERGAVFGKDELVEAAENLNDLSPYLPLVRDLNGLSKTGSTALGLAALHGHLRACKQLIDAGADPHAVNRDGVPPFLMARSHPEVMALLIANGADPFARNAAGDNILVHALKSHITGEQFSTLCDTLMEKVPNADLLFKNKNHAGQTVVHELAQTQRPGFDFARFLSDGPGASMVNVCDNRGITPLMLSCKDHTDSSCEVLIKAGAQIDAQDDRGFTPLMHAVSMTSNKTAKTLIAHGADLQMTCRMGKTALDHAIKSKASKVIVTLQAMGGRTAQDPDLLSFSGQSLGLSFDEQPLITAMKSEDPEFFRLALHRWMPIPEQDMKEVQKYAKGSPKRSEMRAILQSHCAQLAIDSIVPPSTPTP